MKIAYVTPGSGDNFYCQNCFRDDEFLTSLILMGHNVHKVPMYLPSGFERDGKVSSSPVFYGAINVYLREKIPGYKHAPNWMEKAFDSQPLLRYAAKKSGSTDASGLEGMTLSMLHGESGRHAAELDNLVRYLQDKIKPDVVHLSNALLLGLAYRLKHDLGAKVVCSLQDENEWIDEMEMSQQSAVWGLMGDKAEYVDTFVATSQYYSKKSQKEMSIPADKIQVIDGGVNLDGYQRSPLPFEPPVIGYLCRMSEYFGMGIVVDAFLILKKDSRFKDLKLFVTGGYTSLDKPFFDAQVKKIRDQGTDDDFMVFQEFDKKNRIEFLKSLTLLSVPVPSGEAFGAYQVEALAAGVPVVQPNVGCYPEFIEATKGGIIYEPNNPEQLAQAISSLLTDPDRVRTMGEQGNRVVMQRYTMAGMAKSIVNIYENMLG